MNMYMCMELSDCVMFGVVVYIHLYMYVREMKERRKKERSKQGQINNKAKQHSTPKAITFPKKNELPWVGLEPTTLYTLDMYMYTVGRSLFTTN